MVADLLYLFVVLENVVSMALIVLQNVYLSISVADLLLGYPWIIFCHQGVSIYLLPLVYCSLFGGWVGDTSRDVASVSTKVGMLRTMGFGA